MEYGIFNIADSDYRALPALSNGELQIFAKDASLYVWNKTAPVDPNKSTTAEFGKALHVMLLEPQNFDEKILVSSVKGRATKTFIQEQIENPDKIVITEAEHDQLRFMELSAYANPMFKRILDSDGRGEASVTARDKGRGLDLKIRVDKLIETSQGALQCDLKTTADIEEWRSDKPWINPLFKHGYGHTAAFYLYVGSLHYGVDLQEYAFPIVQKSASLGRYPATVFRITRDDLERIGFWAEVQANLDAFAEAKKNNAFTTFEQFPNFS